MKDKIILAVVRALIRNEKKLEEKMFENGKLEVWTCISDKELLSANKYVCVNIKLRDFKELKKRLEESSL